MKCHIDEGNRGRRKIYWSARKNSLHQSKYVPGNLKGIIQRIGMK